MANLRFDLKTYHLLPPSLASGSPAISPDGQWVVFATGRDRTTAEDAQDLVPTSRQGRAVRLTDDKWEDGPAEVGWRP